MILLLVSILSIILKAEENDKGITFSSMKSIFPLSYRKRSDIMSQPLGVLEQVRVHLVPVTCICIYVYILVVKLFDSVKDYPGI